MPIRLRTKTFDYIRVDYLPSLVGIDQLNENTSRYQTYNDYGHTHSFQIEREMQAGDTLTIIDQYSYNTVRDFYEFKCSTNQQEHSCSHITGRLIKRL